MPNKKWLTKDDDRRYLSSLLVVVDESWQWPEKRDNMCNRMVGSARKKIVVYDCLNEWSGGGFWWFGWAIKNAQPMI